MGLFDLFRSYFPANHNERLGPNDLPSDVLNDLRNNNEQLGPDDFPSDVLTDLRNHHQESSHDMEKEFQNVFHQMDSMFKSFFGSGPSFDYFQGGPSIEPDNGKEKSLREKMFDDGKENSMVISPFQDDENHSDRFEFKFHTPIFRDLWQSPFNNQIDDNLVEDEDRDLDGEYESGTHSIDDIISSQNQTNDQSIFGFGENLPSTGCSSAFKYSTVSKKVNPDGSIETTSRKRDSDGNEVVVVSRCLEEQTHTVTTKKNNAGEEEKIESFVNMDQDDLQKFDERWDHQSRKGPLDMVIAPDLFSTWWKPKL